MKSQGPFYKVSPAQKERMMTLLIELDTARLDGQPWIEFTGGYNAKTYYALVKRGLIQSRSDDDYKIWYCITEKGTEAILDGDEEAPEPPSRRKPDIKPVPQKNASPHPWRGDGPPQPDETTESAMAAALRDTQTVIPPGPATYRDDDHDCESCVYKQALQLAATKYPALTKLVEALEDLQ